MRSLLLAAALAGCGGVPFSATDPPDAQGTADVVGPLEASLKEDTGEAREASVDPGPDAGVDAPPMQVEAGADSSDPPEAGWPADAWAYPDAPHDGDAWGCPDGAIIEKQYPTNVNCSTSVASCDLVSGFIGDPPCGALATFVQCGQVDEGCGEFSRTLQAQRCTCN